MRQIVCIKPLESWPGPDGKTYKASSPSVTLCPPDGDGHFSAPIGKWTDLVMKGGKEFAAQIRTRQLDKTLPGQNQRFEFKLREVAEPTDDVASLFADLPVEGIDGKVKDAEPAPSMEDMKAAVEEIERQRAVIADLNSKLDAGAKLAAEPAAAGKKK